MTAYDVAVVTVFGSFIVVAVLYGALAATGWL